jgi:thioredoxin 1
MNKKKIIILSLILLAIGVYIADSAGRRPMKKTESKTINNADISKKIESKPTTNTEESSQEIKVTFIELGSVKCVPCKMMQPIMDEIEKEYVGQVKVVFHDVWTPEGQPYSKQYGIQGIPTQIFLDKDGKEFHRHTGYYPKEEIEKVLKMQGVK